MNSLAEALGNVAAGLRAHSGALWRARQDSPTRPAAASSTMVRRRSHSQPHPHARGLRKCHRGELRDRRFHQLSAAPDRHRAPHRECRWTSRIGRRSATISRCSPTSSPRASSWAKAFIAPAVCPPSSANCSAPASIHGEALTVTGKTIGENYRDSRKLRITKVIRPYSTSRSKRTPDSWWSPAISSTPRWSKPR